MSGAREVDVASEPMLSFEFFPPKNPQQAAALREAASRLSEFAPAFVSMTYGAGGSSQERSLTAAASLVEEAGLTVAAHLTCVGASRAQLMETADKYRALGIERFVALRGDPPGGLEQPYEAHPDGFRDTADLVAALKRSGARDVAVSAYPERHPQSPDWKTEIAVLKGKVDAGADRAVTQFFFDTDVFEAYVERVRAAGISIPIVPGLIPIGRFASVRSFAERCGSSVPLWLLRRFAGLEEESLESQAVAVDTAVAQVEALRRLGVRHFHFYTLNRADLCERVCQACALGEGKEKAAA